VFPLQTYIERVALALTLSQPSHVAAAQEAGLWVIDRTDDLQDRPSKSGLHLPRVDRDGALHHHSAVHRGFGLSRGQLAAARRALEEDFDAVVSRWRNADGERIGLAALPSTEILLRVEALSRRYKQTPYAQIFHPGLNVLFLNLKPNVRGWHGGRANRRYYGFCWDENSLYESVEHADQAILAVRTGRRFAAPHLDRSRRDSGHCAWTNKPHDPGRDWIERVLLPAAEADGVEVDLDFHLDVRGARSLRSYLG
jgi:hypothetical protein